MTKIVLELIFTDGLGGKLIAKKMLKPIKNSLKSAISHPAIKEVKARVEDWNPNN